MLVLGTFALSNPLLHLAKICNQLNVPGLRLGGFLLFAATFFATRVLLVPWAVLKPAMLDSRCACSGHEPVHPPVHQPMPDQVHELTEKAPRLEGHPNIPRLARVACCRASSGRDPGGEPALPMCTPPLPALQAGCAPHPARLPRPVVGRERAAGPAVLPAADVDGRHCARRQVGAGTGGGCPSQGGWLPAYKSISATRAA